MSLLVAAMCHDTDHPGVMNLYLVNTRCSRPMRSPQMLQLWGQPAYGVTSCSMADYKRILMPCRHPLAILYNNQSVLENHHCSTSIALLERPDLDFLAALSPDMQSQIQRCCASYEYRDAVSLCMCRGATCGHGSDGASECVRS